MRFLLAAISKYLGSVETFAARSKGSCLQQICKPGSYTRTILSEPRRPCSETDKHGAPWRVGEAVTCEAAMIEDIVVRSEDAVRQPVAARERPDVFVHVGLGAFGRQLHEAINL